jgi:hypothetical protein
MTPEQIYFKHLAGASALMAWCRRWMQISGGVSLSDNTATLGPLVAQRMGIAWPKRKRFASGPSLLYQSTEAQWVENIRWTRAVLQQPAGQSPPYLALVAKKIVGDDTKFMNIPVFSVRIPLATENADLWMGLDCDKVELRQLWQEEGESKASVSPAFAALPLSIASAGELLFSPDELEAATPFHELLERRLRQTGIENDPGFAGSAAPVDDPYLKAQQDYRKNLGAPEAS